MQMSPAQAAILHFYACNFDDTVPKFVFKASGFSV
jgi:hypothetical protein